ncbi:MAG TPA: TPM domain-containing protein [Candidatus Baltobacteraceae bacterium]
MKAADRERIRRAIVGAESRTSGRIAVKVVNDARVDDALASAEKHFGKHTMHQTPDRNGILILIAPRARRFAVYGDRNVHERLGDGFWNHVVEEMQQQFAAGDVVGAALHGVERLGTALHEHFPRRDNA